MKQLSRVVMFFFVMFLVSAGCKKGDQGPAGPQGAEGQQGMPGPAASVGNNGDYYLDKSTYNLYGPKTAGAWDAALSLQGPAGPQGPAGTSNVIYSAWKYATNFNDTTIDNSALKAGYVAAPSLSTTILNSGTVIIYFTFGRYQINKM